ncbi:hypothetical protein ACLOJK_035309 [Asimina triloba]
MEFEHHCTQISSRSHRVPMGRLGPSRQQKAHLARLDSNDPPATPLAAHVYLRSTPGAMHSSRSCDEVKGVVAGTNSRVGKGMLPWQLTSMDHVLACCLKEMEAGPPLLLTGGPLLSVAVGDAWIWRWKTDLLLLISSVRFLKDDAIVVNGSFSRWVTGHDDGRSARSGWELMRPTHCPLP